MQSIKYILRIYKKKHNDKSTNSSKYWASYKTQRRLRLSKIKKHTIRRGYSKCWTKQTNIGKPWSIRICNLIQVRRITIRVWWTKWIRFTKFLRNRLLRILWKRIAKLRKLMQSCYNNKWIKFKTNFDRFNSY